VSIECDSYIYIVTWMDIEYSIYELLREDNKIKPRRRD